MVGEITERMLHYRLNRAIAFKNQSESASGKRYD
jgi:hypothetical protein